MKGILNYFVIGLLASCTPKNETVDVDFLDSQFSILVNEADKNLSEGNEDIFPRCINKDGSLRFVKKEDWCSGFFPGTLWYMYEYTNNENWKNRADKYTRLLESVKDLKNTHDLGFMLYSCYGNGYRLTGNEYYKNVLVDAAKSLVSRYDANVGCIRSWDFGKWNYPVIIDNMMNLDLLFFASEVTGDSIYRNIAINHANTTLKNHFRDDCSSYHVISYNNDGSVESKGTHQGINDESVWSRGQSWGAYGYTMCYRFTKDEKYLRQAEKIIEYFFSLPDLPEDLIPYWDMSDTDIPNSPRDVSAAAVFASALYELSIYVENGKQVKYRNLADSIMNSLNKGYLCDKGQEHGFILRHSTGNYPANDEIDTSIMYAEYYYMEALVRQRDSKIK